MNPSEVVETLSREWGIKRSAPAVDARPMRGPSVAAKTPGEPTKMKETRSFSPPPTEMQVANGLTEFYGGCLKAIMGVVGVRPVENPQSLAERIAKVSKVDAGCPGNVNAEVGVQKCAYHHGTQRFRISCTIKVPWKIEHVVFVATACNLRSIPLRR